MHRKREKPAENIESAFKSEEEKERLKRFFEIMLEIDLKHLSKLLQAQNAGNNAENGGA